MLEKVFVADGRLAWVEGAVISVGELGFEVKLTDPEHPEQSKSRILPSHQVYSQVLVCPAVNLL